MVAAAGGLRLHTVVSSQGASVSADWPEAKVAADLDALPATDLVTEGA